LDLPISSPAIPVWKMKTPEGHAMLSQVHNSENHTTSLAAFS
jgi:hypothetical protein